MNIYSKLTALQNKLKAPKGQFNKFGKYRYRSMEDIMEAVKPLLAENNLTLIISDSLNNIGTRYYITATATLVNSEKPEETITATAMARESETKKGMDDSQITGTASSYARKYCLNGLFAIDDTKDADSMDNSQPQPQQTALTPQQINELAGLLKAKKADQAAFLKFAGAGRIEDINPGKFNQLKSMLLAKVAA